ncbi:MAG: DUF1801 domain-containing protein [Lutibacter sp.]|uniref:DUF1801 domain-containing protein n=1 Tax=Lutibacter sp. TaxID=1925666 RepID=UPI0017A3B033|nr:DUF1801 domain-containing protein [Lutibacter sp.]MBT8318148.1 DUF1801 domain-containing protein [Lutibacter sp.]NNJ59008.1 DUF1801 domain-containing protein [Lutibacter sp.]
MNPVEQYILNQEEPYQSIMLYVRGVIRKTLPNIEEKFSYNIPLFNLNNKPMLYLNVLKGTNFVDIAFVQGILLKEKYPQLKNENKRKQVRSLQVKSLESFDELQFIELLKDAAIFLAKSKRAWII